MNDRQIIKCFSFSLSTADESSKALEAACVPHGGKSPDAIFLCAGASRPKFIVDSTEQDMLQGMVEGYWVQAWSAMVRNQTCRVTSNINMLLGRHKAYGKRRCQRQNNTRRFDAFVHGLCRIWLVHSRQTRTERHVFIAFKFHVQLTLEIKGLADTLRSECLLYGIDVHFFAPNTMHTASYAVEQQTKPWITNKIEEGDAPSTPEHAALSLLKGLSLRSQPAQGKRLAILHRRTKGSGPYLRRPYYPSFPGIHPRRCTLQ